MWTVESSNWRQKSRQLSSLRQRQINITSDVCRWWCYAYSILQQRQEVRGYRFETWTWAAFRIPFSSWRVINEGNVSVTRLGSDITEPKVREMRRASQYKVAVRIISRERTWYISETAQARRYHVTECRRRCMRTNWCPLVWRGLTSRVWSIKQMGFFVTDAGSASWKVSRYGYDAASDGKKIK